MSGSELNPYAPPAPSERAPLAVETLGPSGLSPSNLRLARLYLGGALFFLTVGGAAGGLMRAHLWSPQSSSGAEAYNKIFLTHGCTLAFGVSIPALACGIGALLVPSAMGGSSATTAKLALGGWVIWTLGVVSLVASAQREGAGFGIFGVALGVALMGVHLGLVCVRGMTNKTARSTVAPLAFVVGLGWIAYECLAGGVASLERFPIHPSFVVLYEWTSAARVGAANALMAFVLGLHLLLRRRDAESTSRPSVVPVLFVVLGVAPALLLLAAVSAVIAVAPVELYLHDTYFDVARRHAEGSVVLLAGLAGAHAWFEQLTGRRYAQVPAILAAIVIPFGLFATTFHMVRLGREGMPRRYASYLEVFEPLHRAVGMASAVTAFGFALLAVSVLLGKRIETRGARADAISGSRA